jgi:hypothetical protein
MSTLTDPDAGTPQGHLITLFQDFSLTLSRDVTLSPGFMWDDDESIQLVVKFEMVRLKTLTSRVVALYLTCLRFASLRGRSRAPRWRGTLRSSSKRLLCRRTGSSTLRSTITHIASGLRVFTHTNPSFAQTDHRKKKLVEYLLANGVDVKAASIDGWTALHLQVQALFRNS